MTDTPVSNEDGGAERLRPQAANLDPAPPTPSAPRWDENERRHAEAVSRAALELFDGLQFAHHLDAGAREVLAAATQMAAETGLPSSLEGARALTSAQFPERLPDEQDAIALLLALWSGGLRRRDLEKQLRPAARLDRPALLTLQALLRLANGLDYSASQSTQLVRVQPVPGGAWVMADGPQAEADVVAANAAARAWNAAGLPRLRFMTSTEAQNAAFKPGKASGPGILASDEMAEAGRKVWRYQFSEMLSHEAGTRLGEDPEELHDMRVASRRMRAAFEVFGDAFDQKKIKPHLKGLKAVGRALGRVRDLDVSIERTLAYQAGLPEEQRPGLEPLLDAWQQERDQARTDLLELLDSRAYQDFKWEFNDFVSTPGAGAKATNPEIPEPRRVCEVAPVLIYTRLAAVRAYDLVLNTATTEQLHALRIEFKKLRYTVEYFREVLGDEAKPVINDLKQLQDHLGDLHDAVVATQTLRAFLEQWEAEQVSQPIQGRQSPEAIVSYLAARHADLHRLTVTFPETWAHFQRPEFRRSLGLAVSAL